MNGREMTDAFVNAEVEIPKGAMDYPHDPGDQPFADLATGINAVVRAVETGSTGNGGGAYPRNVPLPVCPRCAAKDQRITELEAQGRRIKQFVEQLEIAYDSRRNELAAKDRQIEELERRLEVAKEITIEVQRAKDEEIARLQSRISRASDLLAQFRPTAEIVQSLAQ